MAATLITLTNVQLAFGHHPLLDHADLTIVQGERIGLIGRNGAGKSSMLRLLTGASDPDDGVIARTGGLRIATVEQEPEIDESGTFYDAVFGPYDPDSEDWQRPTRVRGLIEQLGFSPDTPAQGLSGGTRKRLALARALADQPDLLLLDEPTNHLDVDGITWLESTLREAPFAVLFITHDRRFLDAVCSRIVELDRGKLLSFPGNFSDWQARKAQWLESERLENARFDKLLAQEEVWIRKGVEARRTRNEGRVRRLEQLRRERGERRERQGNVSLAVAEGARSGKLVAELQNVNKHYGDRAIVRDYSTTIMRGDRIGLLGPNGVGKTTLLKLILAELAPDSGTVRIGTNVSVAYFDQMRSQLDDNATLADVINPGSEWVEIGGQRKHVMSYLGDFLFSPARAGSPVSSLSGGERARLLLARLFARPANVLVLDEPTNDLDIETLELLEELLQDYTGTVLLVSHDRAFLDNVVTQTIASEGAGTWRDYVGGYQEWLAQRPGPPAGAPAASAKAESGNAGSNKAGSNKAESRKAGASKAESSESGASKAESRTTESSKTASRQSQSGNSQPAPASPGDTPGQPAAADKPTRRSRLSSWEQRELDALPDAIAANETEQAELAQKLAQGDLYRNAPDEITRIGARSAQLEAELISLFERWEALEARKQE